MITVVVISVDLEAVEGIIPPSAKDSSNIPPGRKKQKLCGGKKTVPLILTEYLFDDLIFLWNIVLFCSFENVG